MDKATDGVLLALDGSTKTYGSIVANDSVSLAVRRGHIHAVLGENGAGKSTLMKIIYGVTQADAGEIRSRSDREKSRPCARARHRHGVSALLAVRDHDGGREHFARRLASAARSQTNDC